MGDFVLPAIGGGCWSSELPNVRSTTSAGGSSRVASSSDSGLDSITFRIARRLRGLLLECNQVHESFGWLHAHFVGCGLAGVTWSSSSEDEISMTAGVFATGSLLRVVRQSSAQNVVGCLTFFPPRYQTRSR